MAEECAGEIVNSKQVAEQDCSGDLGGCGGSGGSFSEVLSDIGGAIKGAARDIGRR